jgi:hypothetical protein
MEEKAFATGCVISYILQGDIIRNEGGFYGVPGFAIASVCA